MKQPPEGNFEKTLSVGNIEPDVEEPADINGQSATTVISQNIEAEDKWWSMPIKQLSYGVTHIRKYMFETIYVLKNWGRKYTLRQTFKYIFI